jgi:hypothetical protein
MPRAPATFKQADVTRALRGAEAAGRVVHKVEIDRAGKIVLVMIQKPDAEPPPPPDQEIVL